MTTETIAIIGCGNMGRSLIGGLLAAGHAPAALLGADPSAAQRNDVARRFHVTTLDDNSAAVAAAATVLLVVKPQQMQATIQGCAAALRRHKPLIISVAAGVRLQAIRGWLGAELPLVRAMSNTAASIRAGSTGMYCAADVGPEQRAIAQRILAAVGDVVWVDDEALLDVITALSGSGPAYFFLFMEALEQAAVQLGLDRAQARRLTLSTAAGAARLALESGQEPAELRRQVTSPGGTTEQGLQVLDRDGLHGLVQQALSAAARRARELADEYSGG